MYAAAGRKQRYRQGRRRPTGIVYNGGDGFLVRGGGRDGAGALHLACEDGMIRGWAPTSRGAGRRERGRGRRRGVRRRVFRGPRARRGRLYATDFHNARVSRLRRRWRRVDAAAPSSIRAIPAWYAPFGIGRSATGSSSHMPGARPSTATTPPAAATSTSSTSTAPRSARRGTEGARPAVGGRTRAAWLRPARRRPARRELRQRTDQRLRAARSRLDASRAASGQGARRLGDRFRRRRHERPATTLFYAAGPHRWHGASEVDVHGALGSIAPG